ncbi:MAG: FecR domain-containing protein [Archangium sp.]
MSSHLEHEVLWSLAKNELETSAQRDAEQHLAGCADCRVALEDIKLATSALFDLPPVPAMPDAMARRIGQNLAEEADARAAKSFTSWWQSLFTPRFVFAAAMAVLLTIGAAYVLSRETPVAPTNPVNPNTPAPNQIAMPTPNVPAPTPVPVPVPNVPAPAKKKLQVTVASAKKATANKKQVLDEGSVVATQAGGSVWMQLPDGSRAGLTSASQITLTKLETDALTLDIAKGSLALVVPHREDRVLTVVAGEIEVKDLGTRFLVNRESTHTVVAVEEGVVEVKSPAGTRLVKAGHAVTWREGKLQELDWEPTAPPQPKVVVQQPAQNTDADVKSIARLDEEDEDDATPPIDDSFVDNNQLPTSPPPETVQQPPDRTVQKVDEEWAAMPNSADKTKKLPPVSTFAPKKKERGLSLRSVERALREVGSAITSPNGREARARNVTLAANAGDCVYALQLADKWLTEPVTGLKTEPSMRRDVQLQQVRCLNHLGRKDDANALQKIIDGR